MPSQESMTEVETLEVVAENRDESAREAPTLGFRTVSVFRPVRELIIEDESVQP